MTDHTPSIHHMNIEWPDTNREGQDDSSHHWWQPPPHNTPNYCHEQLLVGWKRGTMRAVRMGKWEWWEQQQYGERNDNSAMQQTTTTQHDNRRVTIGDKWYPTTTNSSTLHGAWWGGGYDDGHNTTPCSTSQHDATLPTATPPSHRMWGRAFYFNSLHFPSPTQIVRGRGALNYKFYVLIYVGNGDMKMGIWCTSLVFLPCILY